MAGGFATEEQAFATDGPQPRGHALLHIDGVAEHGPIDEVASFTPQPNQFASALVKPRVRLASDGPWEQQHEREESTAPEPFPVCGALLPEIR
jgi:hypothetical protein